MRTRKVCQLQLEFPKNTRRQLTQSKTAQWACQSNEYIVNYRVITVDDLGPVSYSVDEVPANYSFVSTSEYEDAFQSALDATVSLSYQGAQLADLNAQLNTAHSNLISQKNSILSSHQTIRTTMTIRGAGFGNGRTIGNKVLEVTIADIPEALLSRESLGIYFQRIIDDFVANNEIDPSESGFSEEKIGLSNIVQVGYAGTFVINKYHQLVRHYYDNGHKAEIISPSHVLIKGTLKYSSKYQTLFALVEDENDDTNILAVSFIDDQWKSTVLKKWGPNILPESFQVLDDQFGVMGVNELGNLVLTWEDSNGETQFPNGKKLSYAIIHEVNNIV